MTAALETPRSRFLAQERREPVVAQEVLGLPGFSVVRRCTQCGNEMPEDREHFHADDTRKGWTSKCRECRNERDRNRYHSERKNNWRIPVGRSTQHYTGHWCPLCGPTQDRDCATHEIAIIEARATCRTVEGDEKLPPNSLHMAIECDVGRGKACYGVTLILGPSLYGKVEYGPIDIETGEPTGGFLDEIESARRRMGNLWIDVHNTATLRQLHIYGVATFMHLWGR